MMSKIKANHNVSRQRIGTPLLLQHIPHTADSMNQFGMVFGFQLGAQVADIDFDDVGLTAENVSPNLFIDLLPG